MNIEAEIRKKDLLAMQVFLAFRLKVNWYFIGILFIAAGSGSIYLIKTFNIYVWFAFSFFVAIIVFVGFTAIGSLIQAFFATIEKGYIGPHIYKISADGFFESTAGTETKSKWAGVEKLYKSRSYLFVKISSFRIHIIPKKSFANQQQFEECAKLITSYIKNA